MGIDSLLKRANTLHTKVEQLQQSEQAVVFQTYWGDEEIPREPGDCLFVTQWPGGPLEEDNEV